MTWRDRVRKVTLVSNINRYFGVYINNNICWWGGGIIPCFACQALNPPHLPNHILKKELTFFSEAYYRLG